MSDLIDWMRSIGFLPCVDHGEYSVTIISDDTHEEYVHLVIDVEIWAAYIEEYTSGGESLYIIEIGKFETQQEILALCKGLKAHITEPIPPCPGCERNVKRLSDIPNITPYCHICLWPLP